MKTRHFRELQVWQKSMQLSQQVYQATGAFPKAEMFGLTSQMRRASVSIPSNIAEGHGRSTDKQLAMFLCHARGSLYELETQVEISKSLTYLAAEDADTLLMQCQEISRMMNALLKTVRSRQPATS